MASAADASQIPGTSFFVLRQLEGCWHSGLLNAGIFEELQDDANSEDQFGVILEALLAARFAPARDYTITLLVGDQTQKGQY